jgi:carboxymethylenebutenolidase
MADHRVSIVTADGTCPTHVMTPDQGGPWPAVIIYMDALGMRQALVDMAARLAGSGYLVLLPDLFYRSGEYRIPAPNEVFASADPMAIIRPLVAETGPLKAAHDTGYFLDYLDRRGDVRGDRIGVVGFCMGGGMALTVAGTWPERIAAAASFHGGHLATDEPDSPHLVAPNIQAEVYIAGADKDRSYPPEMAARLGEALATAGVQHRSEIYEGTSHGWMKPDFSVYDEDAAERGWSEMLALFARTLG